MFCGVLMRSKRSAISAVFLSEKAVMQSERCVRHIGTYSFHLKGVQGWEGGLLK